jgi:hypothetical protein
MQTNEFGFDDFGEMLSVAGGIGERRRSERPTALRPK